MVTSDGLIDENVARMPEAKAPVEGLKSVEAASLIVKLTPSPSVAPKVINLLAVAIFIVALSEMRTISPVILFNVVIADKEVKLATVSDTVSLLFVDVLSNPVNRIN